MGLISFLRDWKQPLIDKYHDVRPQLAGWQHDNVWRAYSSISLSYWKNQDYFCRLVVEKQRFMVRIEKIITIFSHWSGFPSISNSQEARTSSAAVMMHLEYFNQLRHQHTVLTMVYLSSKESNNIHFLLCWSKLFVLQWNVWYDANYGFFPRVNGLREVYYCIYIYRYNIWLQYSRTNESYLVTQFHISH